MRRLLACLLVGFLLVSLIGCHRDTNSVLSSLSPAERLSAVTDGTAWYYATPEGIRREDTTTGENCLLVAAKNPTHLQVLDGNVYYILASDAEDDFSLYRVEAGGGPPEIVFTRQMLCGDKGTQVNEWRFHNGRYYVQVNLQLFVYDPATGQGDTVNQDVGTYALDGNSLYHIDHAARTFTIYRTDLTTGEQEILLGDGIYEDNHTDETVYSNLCLLDGVLYYTTRHPISLYRLENGQSTLISNSDTIGEFSLSAYAGRLYFMERTDGVDSLKEYDPASGTLQKITSVMDYHRSLTVKNGYFFYYSYDEASGEQTLQSVQLMNSSAEYQ